MNDVILKNLGLSAKAFLDRVFRKLL